MTQYNVLYCNLISLYFLKYFNMFPRFFVFVVATLRGPVIPPVPMDS